METAFQSYNTAKDVTIEMLMVCLENLGKVAKETTAYSFVLWRNIL